MSKIHVLRITPAQLDMFTKIFASAKTVEPTPTMMAVEAETVRDQHAAGKLSHEKMVEKIRLAASVLALINWKQRIGDTGHIWYARKAKAWLQQHGYARIIRVHGKTDSDYVEISTSWVSTKNQYDMIYKKTWAEWRAIWRESLPFVEKHANGK